MRLPLIKRPDGNTDYALIDEKECDLLVESATSNRNRGGLSWNGMQNGYGTMGRLIQETTGCASGKALQCKHIQRKFWDLYKE